MKILGDPHLGRTFTHNVPLHRRGERERMIREQFVRELDPQGAKLHVCMGDLFDQAVGISYDTIMFAAETYRKAAYNHPDTEFVVIRGNHDAGRDLKAITAFDIFSSLLGEDVIIVSHYPHRIGEHVFFGWSPEKSAEECVRDAEYADGATTAWGHWDVDLRSHHHNLIPTKTLADRGITKAYTGHVHLPSRFTRDGVDVTVTGSMTGLAHGEGHPYVTLTLDELAETDVTNLCVRIRLAPGEEITEIPNCLQWQVEQAKEPVEGIEITLDGFDMTSIYTESFSDLAITPDVKGKIDHRWQQIFTKLA